MWVNSRLHKTVPKFAPSQSLPVALSQYAPGKQVWISGKCYTSGALFSPARRSLKDAWAAKKIYLDCKTCGYSHLAPIGSGLAIGSHLDCDACGSSNSVGPLRHWIRPPGFAHPITEQEVTSPDEIPETSYATRAQLTMASPARDMWTDINERLAVFSTQASLLVSNSGPQKEGYRYCVGCGRIEAETAHHKTLGKAHDKPYKDDSQTCNVFSTPNIVLGTDFLTDIALYSIRVQEPLRLLPAHSVTKVALRTVSEALTSAATSLLQIEPGELMAEFRPALTPEGIQGNEAQIFIYDTLPGGAGFAQDAASLGIQLFDAALELMEGCPEKCDGSCYACLRTFRNRLDHGLIDRHAGASLLRYIIYGTSSYSAERVQSSEHLLYTALVLSSIPDTSILRKTTMQLVQGGEISVPITLFKNDGKKLCVFLSDPLAESIPASLSTLPNLADSSLIVVNELIVRKNLAAATDQVMDALNSL